MNSSVLYIDDEPEVRLIFERMASRLGYRVSLACDGSEAIQMVRQQHFTIIVTDLRMPGLDGLAVLECVRALSPSSVTMLATGAPELELPSGKANDCSLAGILRKPFALKQLDSALGRAMKMYQTEQEVREPLSHRLLLIEDDPLDARLTMARLSKDLPELSVQLVGRLDDAEAYLAEHSVGTIIADLSLPDGRGLDAVERLRAVSPDSAIVVLSGMQSEQLALSALQRGAQDYIVKDLADGPTLKRSIRYAQERKACEKQLMDLAYREPLTGLPNRKLFRDRLLQTLARARRHESEFAVVFIDLDHFKVINDRLGHEAGDHVLQITSQRLLATVRESDTVARLGGDEFAVILENARQSDVAQLARRMIAVVCEPIAFQGEQVRVGASVGAAGYPDHGFTADGLLRAADAAMYRSKRAGRGVFHWATVDHDEPIAACSIESELKDALAGHALSLQFQPQISMCGQTVGFEALLRWHRANGSDVSPAQVVRLLQELGLTSSLTRACVRQACELLASLPAGPWRVALNLTAAQLDAELLSCLSELTEHYGVSPFRLEVELSESSLDGSDDCETAAILAAIRQLGTRVVLDNFGTGASSLTYLKRLPLDGVKVDSSFLTVGTSSHFSRSVVELCKALGLTVAVEKIEGEVPLRHVAGSGCDILQGRWLSSPLNPDQVGRWLEQSIRPLPSWALGASKAESSLQRQSANGS